ncbi:hypothetical protein [Pontibacter chitinilyticus]
MESRKVKLLRVGGLLLKTAIIALLLVNWPELKHGLLDGFLVK